MFSAPPNEGKKENPMTNGPELKRALVEANENLKVAKVEKARIVRQIEDFRIADPEAHAQVFAKRRRIQKSA